MIALDLETKIQRITAKLSKVLKDMATAKSHIVRLLRENAQI